MNGSQSLHYQVNGSFAQREVTITKLIIKSQSLHYQVNGSFMKFKVNRLEESESQSLHYQVNGSFRIRELLETQTVTLSQSLHYQVNGSFSTMNVITFIALTSHIPSLSGQWFFHRKNLRYP